MTTYTGRRALATIAGVAIIAAETYLNISHVAQPGTHWLRQPLVLAASLTGVAQAIAMMVLVDAWARRRLILAATCVGVLASAVAYTGTTTYYRIAEAREKARMTAAAPAAKAAATVAALQTIKNDECAKRGDKCRQRETELMQAKSAAAGIVTPTTDHLGALDMVPELALPLMLMLAGFAFIAYAEGQNPMPNPDTISPDELDDVRKVFAPASDSRSRKASPVGAPAGGAARREAQSKRQLVEQYVLTETALGRPIPSQKSLQERFDCPRSTVADIVRDMESRGLISRPRVGRHRAAVAA